MFSRLHFLVILLTALAMSWAACGDDSGSPSPRSPLPADPAAVAQTIRVVTPQPPALPQPPATPAPAVVPPPVTHTEAAPTPVPTRPVVARPAVGGSGDIGYLVSAPIAFRSGYSEGVSVSLFSPLNAPASGEVRLSLTRAGAPIASAVEYVQGAQTVFLNLPQIELGDDYTLGVSGPGFEDSAPMRVIDGAIVFVETDKPIYKPGQKLRVRALRLDADLRPMPGSMTVEVADAKGTRIFREQAVTDEYGMAQVSMPLSREPNLGVWKVTARSGDQLAQTDVRVERYTLPKYEVTVDMPKSWVLADERIAGSVSAEYSFGRAVRGDVEMVAYRYVGEWEEFATFADELDGAIEFELPPAQYVAGVPASGGQGNVRLDVTVSERSTGYVEETTHLLTVASHPVSVRLIAESTSFKPLLPFSILVIAETPDNMPVDTDVLLHVYYYDENLDSILDESLNVSTVNGKALVSIEPPKDAVKALVETDYGAYLALNASYSPSNSFIHLEQTGEVGLRVGDTVRFTVHSTRQGRFYYEIVSRGRVVFSDTSDSAEIAFVTAPAMAPSSRLIVYQILPDNEVAADYISFDVSGGYPMETSIRTSADEARPGEPVEIEIVTQGGARVGLAAVDRSVFILAENRLNLQQVFAELERLYMQPQVELHIDDRDWSPSTATRGAKEAFADAGLVIMTNKTVPEGEVHQMEVWAVALAAAAPASVATPSPVMAMVDEVDGTQQDDQLAEVQRVRQFFPETWLWADTLTDVSGRATMSAEAPDSITTWMLRSVALSKEHGLGIAEAELRVFQPFFIQMDLPYSAVRGEKIPVEVALYNYLDSPQQFSVEMADSDMFELLDTSLKTVSVGPNDLGAATFMVRLTELGSVRFEISARSQESADAVIESLIVEPEGVSHEIVHNRIMSAGDSAAFSRQLPPPGAVSGSARTQAVLTGSYVSQTIEGLENLLRMPFGCGEQNMILFAPNVFVARYLEETGQLKPEVMAKAESLMTTGYQREMIYRRADGSFSAFGDDDDSGSLWLTAFVLKTFAQADGLIYIDDTVLRDAADWTLDHQRPDGSFEPIGFLHHQELLGGLQGNTALTAYVAIALHEAGEHVPDSDRVSAGADTAITYLERRLGAIEDPYTMAIVAYALALGGSADADSAYDRLMSMSAQDENGLHWGGDTGGEGLTTAVETTGYAALALLERGDRISAAAAARWLVSQRNAQGGFGSTQDTVVGLQALIGFAARAKLNVDMTVTLSFDEWSRQIEVNAANADVVQIVDVPVGEERTDGDALRITTEGDGDVVVQVVSRFNMPEVDADAVEVFTIDVDYSAHHVEVDDRISVAVEVQFTPLTPANAGMVVVDVSIPTGFAPVTETLDALVEENHKLKRYEVAGRKVVLYIEDMQPNESIALEFEAVALHPVQAQPVTSQVYSYYSPHWRAQTLGQSVAVGSQ